MKTIDQYLFRAIDHYPYSLTEASEALGYALSYDAGNTMALCLMGRMHAEQLFDYESAKAYFEEALGHNLYALEIYPYYIQTCILNEDYKEANRLIEFALGIKGINKVDILFKKVALMEQQQAFADAKKVLKEIRLLSCVTDHKKVIDEIRLRLNEKIKLKKQE